MFPGSPVEKPVLNLAGGPGSVVESTLARSNSIPSNTASTCFEIAQDGMMYRVLWFLPYILYGSSAKQQISGGLSILVWAFPLASQDQTRHENAKSMNCAMLGFGY